MPRRRRDARRRAALAVTALLAALAVQCLDREEVQCENAVALLVECCVDFPRVDAYCEHHAGSFPTGCDARYPAISGSDADCIVATSCAELVANGVCDRAGAATSTVGSPGPDLCP